MSKIELLYFPGCPNVDAAREQLRKACTVAGVSASWTEIDVSAPDAPAHLRGYGSPSILVGGRDVANGQANMGTSCRLYVGSESPGAPSVGAIVEAIQLAAKASNPGKRNLSALAIIPGVLLSALPILSCPSCWPAYAGILSALGVPFLMKSSWLLPLTLVAFAIALGTLGFRAKLRRGFGPLLLGLLATSFVLAGKFWIESQWITYLGTAFLVGAGLWNAWPKKQIAPSCESCVR